MPQIEHFMNNPLEVQNEWLLRLLDQAKDAEWGKKYGYADIKNLETFKERVPIQEYDDIKPYIIRLRQGETNLLWPSEIKWFAKSSGTTSDKSKFIPVSREALDECHMKGGKDMLAIYCNNYPDTKIFTGKGLVMGGSHKVSEFNSRSYYGDLSAILLQNFPFWAEMVRTPALSIALMDKWETKLETMANATIHEDVTNISGVPSWNLMLLRRILEITGKENILQVWPNLELFVHGGVSFVPYREQFQKIIPSSQMHYMETYNASEGFFGIQDQKNSEEMLLMLDYGVYYEFMPFDELGNPQGRTLSLEEVKTGENYAIIITTNAGLWRYMIGDTVTFTSLEPYRIKITGRTRSFINAFGEEVIIDNAEKALAYACQATGAIVSDYTAAPVFLGENESAAHQWLIEFEVPPFDMDKFTELLDEKLKEVNSDYEAKRSSDILLKRPRISILPAKTFFNWLKQKGKIGGQNKVPRLANDRRYVDEIIKFVGN